MRGRGNRARRAACGAALAVLATQTPAHAEGPAQPQSWITAYADLEAAGVDGEQSWLKGGFGKLRYGGTDTGGTSGFGVKPYLTEAGIALTPKISWSLGATVVAIAQRDQRHAVDLSEAFLTWKPMPMGGLRLSARAGLYWPSVSLEHTGPEWAVRETITPSALNSWIGEEVKVAGAEASASLPLGNHRVTATGGLFADNQTAGTLLAFRGWSMNDEKATLGARYDLPPRSTFWTPNQAEYTTPLYQLDSRVGWYAKLVWRPPVPIEVQGFFYDNRGDPQVIDADAQWAWRTRFGTLGVIADLGKRTRLIAQGMTGRAQMGYRNYPVSAETALDTHFRTAYLLATRAIGTGSVSARIEAFGTHAGGYATTDVDEEHGWAVTAAAKKPIDRYATVLVEALHIDSTRDARTRFGIDPQQSQTMVRVALRLRATR